MRVLLLALTFILRTEISFAKISDSELTQATNVVTTQAESVHTPKRNIVSIDIGPLIGLFRGVLGFGMSYQYLLGDHYSLGGNLYYSEFTEHMRHSPSEMTVHFFNVGVEARFKITSFQENGFYGGIGVVSSAVRADVKMRSAFGDDLGKTGTSYEWLTTLVPRVGHIWHHRDKINYGDFSLSYEPVDKVDLAYGKKIENSTSTAVAITDRKIEAKVTYVFGFLF